MSAAAAVKIAAVLLAAHTAPAFSISATPAVVHARPGQATVIRVTDGGTRPLTVAASAGRVGKVAGQCGVGGAPAPGVHISPAHFRLRPGHSRLVHVRIAQDAPAGDLAAVFTTQAGGHGNARVAAAVGTRLVVGDARPAVCMTAPAGGGSHVLFAGAAAAALALLAAMVAIARRVRRRGSRAAG